VGPTQDAQDCVQATNLFFLNHFCFFVADTTLCGSVETDKS
jgi:hypothetical protein